MALQPNITPYLRNLSIKNARGFAAAAAKVKQSEGDSSNYNFMPREEIKTTKLHNITVSSIETNKPLSKIAIYLKSGSRYEKNSNLGVAHALRVYAGLGTSGSSHFGLTRSIEMNGGNLHCTGGREFIAYSLETTRNKIQKCEKFLQDVVMNQVFKPWELGDHLPRMKLDLMIRSPEVRLIELIHQASFRHGLGNSIYSPKYMVGAHSTEMLDEFVRDTFSEASVVGVGVPHEQVVDFAQRLNIKGGGSKAQTSKFYGGNEIRKNKGGDFAYVALSLEGAKLTDAKSLVACSLIQRALGTGPRTKRGLNPGAKLFPANKDSEQNSSVNAFSSNYTDTGILGVVIAATPCCVEKVTKKAAEILQGTTFSEEDAKRARNQMKGDLATHLETDEGQLEDLGLQSLINNKVVSLPDMFKFIDGVSCADMNKALPKGGKMNIVSYGNVLNVPYLDELK